jgi:hypothetical protein
MRALLSTQFAASRGGFEGITLAGGIFDDCPFRVLRFRADDGDRLDGSRQPAGVVIIRLLWQRCHGRLKAVVPVGHPRL